MKTLRTIALMLMLIFIYFLFVDMFIIASKANGQTKDVIKFDVLYTSKRKFVVKTIRKARAQLKVLPIKVKLLRPKPFREGEKVFNIHNIVNRFVELPIGVRPRLYVYARSTFNGISRWSIGRANVCFPFNGKALAVITNKNAIGEDRRGLAVSVVVHEVAHVLGAKHGTGVMNQDIMQIEGQGFSNQSLTEIKRCTDFFYKP